MLVATAWQYVGHDDGLRLVATWMKKHILLVETSRHCVTPLTLAFVMFCVWNRRIFRRHQESKNPDGNAKIWLVEVEEVGPKNRETAWRCQLRTSSVSQGGIQWNSRMQQRSTMIWNTSVVNKTDVRILCVVVHSASVVCHILYFTPTLLNLLDVKFHGELGFRLWEVHQLQTAAQTAHHDCLCIFTWNIVSQLLNYQGSHFIA